jgi:hypothetical protein
VDATDLDVTESDNVAAIEDERLAAREQIENLVIAVPEDLAFYVAMR